METVLGPSWPKRLDIRLVFIKYNPPGNTDIVHCTLYIVHASANLPCEPLPDIATLEHQSWEFSELPDVIGDQLLVGRVELVAKAARHDLEEGGHTVEDRVGGEGDEGRGVRGSVLTAQPGLPQLLDLLEEYLGVVAVKLVVLSPCRGGR